MDAGNVLLLLIFIGSSTYFIVYRCSLKRSSVDVYVDLLETAPHPGTLTNSSFIQAGNRMPSKRSSKGSSSQTLATPCISALLLVGLCSVGFPGITPFLLVGSLVFGFSGGLLLQAHQRKKKELQYTREIEYYLPVVMERIVMAVQAGFDIISAVQTIKSLSFTIEQTDSKKNEIDPVTQLLSSALELTEAGFPFNQALNEVSTRVNNTALKHAFIHLALAYKEGGELIMPLMELSSSTQLYYQESIEEEIARMPARVTMPLICIFAGLILFFITVPLVQVLDITGKSMAM